MKDLNVPPIEKLEDLINYQVLPILREIERLKEYVDEKVYKETVEPLKNMLIKVKQK